jgi:hypothetical protein
LSEISSQKIGKISFGVGFFELLPRFTTDNHITAMNPRWQHILRKPNFQDLHRLKFTRQVVQTKLYNPMNLHIHKLHQTTSLSAISAIDVNLRGTFFMFRVVFSVAATAAAVARTFPVRVCTFIIFIFGRRLWRCDDLPSLLHFNQLKRTEKKI